MLQEDTKVLRPNAEKVKKILANHSLEQVNLITKYVESSIRRVKNHTWNAEEAYKVAIDLNIYNEVVAIFYSFEEKV